MTGLDYRDKERKGDKVAVLILLFADSIGLRGSGHSFVHCVPLLLSRVSEVSAGADVTVPCVALLTHHHEWTHPKSLVLQQPSQVKLMVCCCCVALC